MSRSEAHSRTVQEILDEARAQLKGETEHDLRVINEAALRAQNQTEQEAAERTAYVICRSCLRLYTDVQWAFLQTTHHKLWVNDATKLEEYCVCEVCGDTLVKRELRQFRPRPEGTRRAFAVYRGPLTSCDLCSTRIKEGDVYVTRLNDKGRPAPGRRTFCCEKCEGIG